MKILITHINYAGMNAREMIYKPLSSKSFEPCRHNGPLHYMQMIGNVQYLKLNLFYIDPR